MTDTQQQDGSAEPFVNPFEVAAQEQVAKQPVSPNVPKMISEEPPRPAPPMQGQPQQGQPAPEDSRMKSTDVRPTPKMQEPAGSAHFSLGPNGPKEKKLKELKQVTIGNATAQTRLVEKDRAVKFARRQESQMLAEQSSAEIAKALNALVGSQ